MKFITELAGLRGWAALMVFIAHLGADGYLPRFIGNGYGKLGLICFFILSGYLIAQVYIYKPFSINNAKSYLIARVARIAPVYFFIILISFIISNYIYKGFHYDFTDKPKLLLSLFFINAPYELWTIPVEVQFYFCFIVFWYLHSVEKLNKWILYALPLLIMIPAVIYYLRYNKVPHVMPSFSVFFFSGVYISLLQTGKYLKFLEFKIPTLLSTLIIVAFLIIFPLVRKTTGLYFNISWFDPVLILAAIIPFILIIVNPSCFSFLRLRPLLFMSEISYGFYLIHRPIMKLFASNFGSGILPALSVFALSVLSGYLIYKLIELPARNYIEAKFNARK